MLLNHQPNLHFHDSALHEEAIAAWVRDNIREFFLLSKGNHVWLDVLLNNFEAIHQSGLYEVALYEAFTMTRLNNHHFSAKTLRWLFEIADRSRLLVLGDPLPRPGPSTLYRGVAGRGQARRVRGLSWTSSLDCAIWFAGRLSPSLHDPAVYSVTVEERDIALYTNCRKEEEYLLLLPSEAKRRRVKGLDIVREHARVVEERQICNEQPELRRSTR